MKYLFFALFAISVSWNVEFTPNDGSPVRHYRLRQEFETLKEAKRFIRWHPKGQYWCESQRYGGEGLCKLSSFMILPGGY